MFIEHLDTLSVYQSAVTDSLRTAGQTAEQPESGSAIFGELLHHVQDSREIEIPFGRIELPHISPVQIGGISIDLSITKHVVFVWLAAIIVTVIAVMVSRKYRRQSVPTGFNNLIESFVVFIRDEVALANMGKEGERYLSYILTVFFFILTMNLLGIVPYGSSATANISVTAGLAVLSFIMIQYSAVRAQGFKQYLVHLTGGVHWLLWPIMVPIEVLGLFTKSFALCMRLFANMTGGHIVILSFLGLIFLFKSYFVTPASVGFALGVYMLELFVAFLQAYIFTLLTSLFMGLGMQAGQHEHGKHDH